MQEFFLNLEKAAANASGTHRDEAGVDVVGAGSAWFRQQLDAVVVVYAPSNEIERQWRKT